MQQRHIEAIVFSLKAAVAAVLSVILYDLFKLPGAGWAAISAVLVIQPSLHLSMKSSLIRVVANIAGAFGGAALFIIIGHTILALAVGVMLTGLLCYLLKADDAMRPAFAAVVIVIFTGDASKWSSSLDRVFAVIIGCICAITIGFIFDRLTGWVKLNGKDEAKKIDQQE